MFLFDISVMKFSLTEKLRSTFLITALIGMSGCIQPPSPIDVEQLSIKTPRNTTLPLDASIDIYVPTEFRPRLGYSSYLPEDEIRLFKRKAKLVFSRAFSEVEVTEDPTADFIVTVLSWGSGLIPYGFKASGYLGRTDLRVRVSRLGGAEIGTYRGRSKEYHNAAEQENLAAENALIKALVNVLNRLIKDKNFLAEIEKN